MAEDKIGASLGLEPIDNSKTEIMEPVKAEILNDADQEKENDYQYARENFYNVIEKGTQALEDMIDIAKASEHPRDYEVISTIMKTLVDANKDLVTMGQKKRENDALNNRSAEEQTGRVTNNTAIFVGSTAELQGYINKMRTVSKEEKDGLHISDRMDKK